MTFLAPRRLLLLSTVAMILIQTVLFIRSASIRGFATGDGGVKLWQVQGILRSGRLDAPIDYPGAIYDPAHTYSPFVPPWFFWQDGQPYSEYTSPFIWSSVPLYALLGHAGLLILPWLCGALLVILSAWLAWQVHPDRSAALVPIIVGVSSPLFVYSMEFWEHTPGAFLAVLALVGLVKAADSSRGVIWLILAGAAIGLGLTMRAELYVYPIAVAIGLVFAPFRRFRSAADTLRENTLKRVSARLPLSAHPFMGGIVRPLIFLAIGGLLIAGPWWIYQTIHWGSPFGPRLAQNVPVLGGSGMLARLRDTTGHNYAMLWPYEGDGRDVVLIMALAAVVLAALLYMLRRIQRSASRIFEIGCWLLAIGLVAIAAITSWRLVQGQRPSDLLTTFPTILLLLLPLRPSREANLKSETPALHPQRGASVGNLKFNLVRFFTITSFAFILLVLIASPFEGGIQWGPRFLLPIVVPLAIAIVTHLDRLWAAANRMARIGLAIVFGALLLAGSYSTWSGVQFMRQGQISSEFMSAVINDSPERVVVADVWFIPQGAPYTLDDKIWLLAEDEKKMFQLLQSLRKQTNEPRMIYVSALTWAHIDPQVVMGPRIALDGEKLHINAPTQYLELSRYKLLK